MKGVGLMNKPFCILFSRGLPRADGADSPAHGRPGHINGTAENLHLLTRGSQTQVELARALRYRTGDSV